MEATYENSLSLRLEVLNGMIAMAQSIAFNFSETPKSVMAIVEREDGTTVTEYVSADEIKTKVTEYLEKMNEKEN